MARARSRHVFDRVCHGMGKLNIAYTKDLGYESASFVEKSRWVHPCVGAKWFNLTMS